MNFDFVDKRLILMVFVCVFVFVFWQPEIIDASLSEEQVEQQILQQRFGLVVVVFVVLYFLLPFIGNFKGEKGFGVKMLGHSDLEDFGVLHAKLVSELSRNGFHEFFVSGYVLSLSSFRKPFGVGTVWKPGVSKNYCIYDGLKNADKVLIFGLCNYHELLRMLGSKNIKESGDLLLKPESYSAKAWLDEGKRNNFVEILREGGI